MSMDALLIMTATSLTYRLCFSATTGATTGLAVWPMVIIQWAVFTLAACATGLYVRPVVALGYFQIAFRYSLTVLASTVLTWITVSLQDHSNGHQCLLLLASLSYLLAGMPLKMLAEWFIRCYRPKLLIVGTDHRLCSTLIHPDSPAGEALVRRYRLVGFVAFDPREVGREIAGVPVLGVIQDLEDICAHRDIHDIAIAMPSFTDGRLLQYGWERIRKDAQVHDLSTLCERLTGRVLTLTIEPRRLISLMSRHEQVIRRLVKRGIDMFIALTGLPLVLMLWPVMALQCRWGNPGPVFERRKMMGRHRRMFRIYRFRAGRVGFEQASEKVRLAVWLHALPVLWSLLRGDVSLVGPQPVSCELTDELDGQIPTHEQRYLVKPGLTGWTQIHGIRVDANTISHARQQLEYDLWYIQYASLELDLWICLQVLAGLLWRSGKILPVHTSPCSWNPVICRQEM